MAEVEEDDDDGDDDNMVDDDDEHEVDPALMGIGSIQVHDVDLAEPPAPTSNGEADAQSRE